MKIIKYKKLNSNKYQLLLENNEKITLYEDVILDKDLLLKKSIDDIDELLDINKKYSLYDVSLKYISIKMRSIKELKKYLQEHGYLINDIDKVIDKLLSNGYLNDELYSKSYIHDRLVLSLDGPDKIKKYLECNNISEEVYSKYLEVFDDKTIEERIDKYIAKKERTNRKSLHIFKNKMLFELENLGYDKKDILVSLDKIDLCQQESLRDKEKERLYRKFERKYSGIELDKKVQESLYQKGFFN